MNNETENNQDKAEKENTNIVQMSYDPTHDDMSEIVLVEGLYES